MDVDYYKPCKGKAKDKVISTYLIIPLLIIILCCYYIIKNVYVSALNWLRGDVAVHGEMEEMHQVSVLIQLKNKIY